MNVLLSCLFAALGAAPGLALQSPPPPAAAGPARRAAAPEELDRLGNAAMRGDLAGVRAALATGMSAKGRTSLGHTPLRMATSFACSMPGAKPQDVLGIVDALIEAGADVNHVDDYGHGDLLMAAQKCKGEVVTRLLKAGGDAEQRSPQGFSPLSMAFIVKNYDAAAALVDHGARLSPESIKKIFEEPPAEPELAALVKRATGTSRPVPTATPSPARK
ncbi:MAG TPA: ankyrin repeat domain-containing protein [Vicinamibacteria bacterium]|nr:ankyrin repeat domain-containing protein [Vicinamibacteria bacterium]